MQVFVNINSQKFLLNGIPYYKNFMPLVIGNKLKVVNVYDSKLQLFDFEDFANVSVNGNTFVSVALLVSALLPTIFTRDTLGSGSSTQLNEIITAPPIVRIGSTNTFSFPIGYTWRYDNALYANTAIINRTIAPATEGFKRIDIGVVDTFNNIVIVEGEENEEVAFEPPTPPNTLRLTAFAVNGDQVEEPTTPIVGVYVEKAEYFQKLITGSGEVSVVLDTQETNFRIVSDDITMIEGTAPTSGYLSQYLREDKLLSFINKTANPIVFKHSLDIHNFRLPNGANLTVQPNEIIRFRQAKDDVSICYEFDSLSRVGSGSTTTPTLQEVTDVGAETTNDVKYQISENTFIIIKSTTQEIEFYEEVSGSPVLRSKMNKSSFNVYRDGGGLTLMDGNSVYIEDATAENSIGLSLDPPTGITSLDLQSATLGATSYFVDKININAAEYPLPSGAGARISKVPIVISSNTTASNDTNYSVIANATFTDPTPTEGKGYTVTVINGTATIGGVGYTVGQKVFRHYHSGSWRTFVYNDEKHSVRKLISDNTVTSPVTGTTNKTLLRSYYIAPNTFASIDGAILESFVGIKTGSNGVATLRVDINTVDSLTGATTIFQMQNISTALWNKISNRSIVFDGGNLSVLGIGQSINSGHDSGSSSVTIGGTTYDVTQGYYLLTSVQLSNGADSFIQRQFILTK